MMQPPRQMVAIAPRSMSQPYSSLPAPDLVEALRVRDDLGRVQRLLDTSSAKAAGVVPSSGVAVRARAGRARGRAQRRRGRTASGRRPPRRCRRPARRGRARSARSSGRCPSARPGRATTSTNGLPVAASVCASTSAVISIRYESRSPGVPVAEDVGDLARGRSRRPRRSRSYASAISCMSAYSMPLCTIFTKCPAPSGPTWVQQGAPSDAFAAIVSSSGPSDVVRLRRSRRA